MTVNKVILLGNLGQNPEVKQTSDGRYIVSFSVATSESWKDKTTGEKKDKTEWHKVVVFNQPLCEVIKKGMADHWIRKGSKVYIDGSLQTRKWTDNNGIDRYVTEVVLNGFNCQFQVLSQNQQGNSNNNQSLQDTAQQEFAGSKVVESQEQDEYEDLPF